MQIEPYLFFEGRCEEAIEFYKKVAGAEVVMLMRFTDSPETGDNSRMPADRNKIMHASFRIGDRTSTRRTEAVSASRRSRASRSR